MISMAEAIQYLRDKFYEDVNQDGYPTCVQANFYSVDELVEDFEDHFAEKVLR